MTLNGSIGTHSWINWRRRNEEAEQVVAHQPAVSFSISIQNPFNRAGGRTSNVRPKNFLFTLFLNTIMKSIVLLVCLACFSTGILVGQQSNRPSRPRIPPPSSASGSGAITLPEPYRGQQRFEYLVRYIITGGAAQSELNKLGLEGWELVAALTPDGNAKANLCYFKRPFVAVAAKEDSAEQAGAGQPATAPESKSDGKDKPQPESKPASR